MTAPRQAGCPDDGRMDPSGSSDGSNPRDRANPRDRGPMQLDGGVGDSPLRPEELETYRTEQGHEASIDEDGDTPAVTPGAEPRPWIVVGIVLLVIFLAILGWALVAPFFL
jgi:hypothetical protein